MTAPTILVIDDEPALSELLGSFLQLKGYQVLIASDGRQGLEMVKAHAPDLVVCDLHLPAVDGLEVITQLRRDDWGREIPVIVLSATAERTEIRQSMNLGGDDFLGKPASFTDILAAVEARLARRQQQLQRQEEMVQSALASYSGIVNDAAGMNHPSQWRADLAALEPNPAQFSGSKQAGASTAKASRPMLSEVPAAATDATFLAITGQRREYVKLSAVLVFMACGEYSKACWGKNQSMMFRKPMKQWAQELAETPFVRVHRQAIINLAFFDFLDKTKAGKPQVHLRGFGTAIAVSQRCMPELNRRLKTFHPAAASPRPAPLLKHI